jgi:hypothetical protein
MIRRYLCPSSARNLSRNLIALLLTEKAAMVVEQVKSFHVMFDSQKGDDSIYHLPASIGWGLLCFALLLRRIASANSRSDGTAGH